MIIKYTQPNTTPINCNLTVRISNVFNFNFWYNSTLIKESTQQ